jgi:antibiotic biosynthesis monooxygenase (ABM) superfamily enzyme
MPLGLDLKSVIVGMLLAYFLVPWVMGAIARGRQPGGRTANV